MPVASVKSVAVPKAITGLTQPGSAKGKLFTTVDGGRLHLAIDNRYAGSINSYNNGFTRFFAGLFGWSEKVNFNGKTRHVDKSDYIKFLNNNTSYKEATLDHIKDFVDFNALKAVPTKELGTMRENISQYKADYLFRKLVRSMVDKEDFEKAEKYVGKGANIDGQFWLRDGHGVSFSNLTYNLPQEKALEFQAGRYSPLLYAAAKSNTLFSSYICSFNPTEATGETLRYERKILEVNPVETVVKRESFVSADGRLLTKQTIKTNTTLRMQDIKTPQYTIRYNPEENALVWTENRDRQIETNYDHPVVRYSTRYV